MVGLSTTRAVGRSPPPTDWWATPSSGEPLAFILSGYMQVGPLVHVSFLSYGPSNPCDLILSRPEKAQLWSKGRYCLILCFLVVGMIKGVDPLGWSIDPLVLAHLAPFSPLSYILERNTSYICGTCYLIKYTHNMFIFLLFQGYWHSLDMWKRDIFTINKIPKLNLCLSWVNDQNLASAD